MGRHLLWTRFGTEASPDGRAFPHPVLARCGREGMRRHRMCSRSSVTSLAEAVPGSRRVRWRSRRRASRCCSTREWAGWISPASSSTASRHRLPFWGRRVGAVPSRGVHPGADVAGGCNRLRTEVPVRVLENEDLVNRPTWLALQFRIGDGTEYGAQKKVLRHV